MKRALKNKLVCGLTVFALAMAGMAFSFPVSADAQEGYASFALEAGASVRIAANYDDAGIRYMMSMSAEDYAAAKESGATFGIIIVPKDYLTEGREINAANVFGIGGTQIYNWATYNAETGEWEYTAEEGKTRIANFETDALYEEDGKYVFKAALTGVLEDNLLREFAGYAYIKTESEVTFDSADGDNVRSMVYVAQKAYESATDETQKESLKTFYIDKVSDVDANYTVRHHKYDGKSETVEEEVLSGKIGSLAENKQKEIEGYVFDAENGSNKVSGTIYANDKLVLDYYYILESVTRKTYGIEDFESMIDITEEEYYWYINSATITKEYVDEEHGNALKIVNNPNQAYTYIKLKPFVVGQLRSGDVLKFDFMLKQPAGVTNFCLRLTELGSQTSIDPNRPYSGLWLRDVTNFNEWLTITMSGSDVDKVIAMGGFGLYVVQNGNPAESNYVYTAYVDNIRIERSGKVSDGTQTLDAMLAERFPDTSVEVVSVVDAKGDAYALTEGKFADTGSYTVTAKVGKEGYNAREVVLGFGVTAPEKFESFEGDFNAERFSVQWGTANLSYSDKISFSGEKSLQVDNGGNSVNTYVFVKLTDEMLNSITENSTLKVRLFIDRDLSNAQYFNVRMHTEIDVNTNHFIYEDNVKTGEWLDFTFRDKDGDKPLDITAIKAWGGFRIIVEQFGGGNTDFNYYVDDIRVVNK